MPCTGPNCKGYGKPACCVSCHFDFEEYEVLPYLPAVLRTRILREHNDLRAKGYPPDEVEEHARWEMDFVRKYCPAEITLQVERDHDHLAKIGFRGD